MKKPVSFKYKVTQEYEVTVYYENGLIQESADDKQEAVEDDILALAFNEDGLVVRTNEEAYNSNGFIAKVTTFDPTIEMVYHVDKLPQEIDMELTKQGLK
jgi:hypothetical protein